MTKEQKSNRLSRYEVPDVSSGFLLWRVSTLWRSSIERVVRSFSLTHPQFVVLATVGWLTKDGEQVNQAAVGALASLDPNTLSQVIRGLEVKKLIKRATSSDGREKKPSLTTEGSLLLKQALPAVEEADAEFFKELRDEERVVMLNLFNILLPKRRGDL